VLFRSRKPAGTGEVPAGASVGDGDA